jgi:DNA uptake protein ComE-like DNA-binding protein
MKIIDKIFCKRKNSFGSALILAVVLSSLLAIVGVLFVLVARMNKMATSAVSDNMELNFAVDTMTAKISQQLVLDVPGVTNIQMPEPNTIDPNATDPNAPGPNEPAQIEEYYDYPDANNLWLASLEPYKSSSSYYWQQISDVTGKLAGMRSNIQADIVSDYEPIVDSNALVANADADGDGVGDSKWIRLDEITSGRGEPIYAAVRIVDNGAMLNVNTAYKFNRTDPNATAFLFDGTNQLQINLMALAAQPGTYSTPTDEINLLQERANYGNRVNPLDLMAYLQKVVWNYIDSNDYTPFDLSDELELRYRYILNHTDIDTRLEAWSEQFRSGSLSTPVTSGGQDLDAWFSKTTGNGIFDPNYCYRHIATIHNMDRIVNPVGSEFNNGKMINVNAADKNLLFTALRAGLRDDNDPNTIMFVDELAAQLAVNILDHRDPDVTVTALTIGPKTFYGFEAQPFISEIGFRISSTNTNDSSNNYFAVELYNPFDVDIPLSDFKLELRDVNDTIVKTIGLTGYVISAESRFVITNNSQATSRFGIDSLISTGGGKEDPNLVLAEYALVSEDPPTYELSERYDIHLRRIINSGRATPAEYLYLDRQRTLDDWFTWDEAKDNSRFYCRDDGNGNYIYQSLTSATNTLGAANGISGSRRNYNITNSAGPFISSGEIARVLTIAPSAEPNDMLGMKLEPEPAEGQIRVDLLNPVFTDIFQYLTVIDPTNYVDPNDYAEPGLSLSETRIKGRININTAPWFVIAQLPWMEPAVAQAITAYRDTISGAFESIAELIYVPQMAFYATDALDLDALPDFTPADGAVDDFEERDIIFSRISNLVTVRSDIFTAYILVRIGVNGPQRRVIAIFDRSGVNSPSDKVRIIAVHPVPDPR